MMDREDSEAPAYLWPLKPFAEHPLGPLDNQENRKQTKAGKIVQFQAGVTQEDYYAPTAESIKTLSVAEIDSPENPSWPEIKTQLLQTGATADDLVELEPAVLIAMLSKSSNSPSVASKAELAKPPAAALEDKKSKPGKTRYKVCEEVSLAMAKLDSPCSKIRPVTYSSKLGAMEAAVKLAKASQIVDPQSLHNKLGPLASAAAQKAIEYTKRLDRVKPPSFSDKLLRNTESLARPQRQVSPFGTSGMSSSAYANLLREAKAAQTRTDPIPIDKWMSQQTPQPRFQTPLLRDKDGNSPSDAGFRYTIGEMVDYLDELPLMYTTCPKALLQIAGADTLSLLAEADGETLMSKWLKKVIACYTLANGLNRKQVRGMTVEEFAQALHPPVPVPMSTERANTPLQITPEHIAKGEAVAAALRNTRRQLNGPKIPHIDFSTLHSNSTGVSEPPETVTETPRSTVVGSLASLKRSERLAGLTWLLVERSHSKIPGDQEAYDWLKQQSDDLFIGELVDYELPVFATWRRYITTARKALDKQKNSPRTGRPTGGSIVRQQDL